MPEINQGIITKDTIIDLTKHTLGQTIKPVHDPDNSPAMYFNYFKLEHTIKLAHRLFLIEQFDDVRNNQKLDKLIAILGMSIWMREWIPWVHHLAEESNFKTKVNQPIKEIKYLSNRLQSYMTEKPSDEIEDLSQRPFPEPTDDYWDRLKSTTIEFSDRINSDHELLKTAPQTDIETWVDIVNECYEIGASDNDFPNRMMDIDETINIITREGYQETAVVKDIKSDIKEFNAATKIYDDQYELTPMVEFN